MKRDSENRGSRVRIAVLGKMNVGKSGMYELITINLRYFNLM